MPVNRYSFHNIFSINPTTGDIYPLFNMRINGMYYPKNYSIPRGLGFGGIDIYRLTDRSFSGTWDDTSNILTIVGII